MSSARALSPLGRSDHLKENVGVSDTQGLPLASPTILGGLKLSPGDLMKISRVDDFDF